MIKVPVAPVRGLPSDPSEMVTQFLFGEQVEILEEKEQWRKCRSMNDGYEGWLDEKLLDLDGVIPSALVFSPLAKAKTQYGEYYCPAGSKVDLASGSAPKDLLDAAQRFEGAPYLWGGKTILGIDCSGLTQVAAALYGIQIPRDAKDQIQVGEEVPFASLAESNDLAFFDNEEGKIIHVGVIRKNAEQDFSILHAAGEVRWDRFDQQGIFREDRGKYTHKLRMIRRLNLNS